MQMFMNLKILDLTMTKTGIMLTYPLSRTEMRYLATSMSTTGRRQF